MQKSIRASALTASILLCLALSAIPAAAGSLYENGPVNGETNAWPINFGFSVTDSFFLAANSSTITGFNFNVWLEPGDVPASVDWSIADSFGSVIGQGMNASLTIDNNCIVNVPTCANNFGYDLDQVSVNGLSLQNLPSGTYYLTLGNATVASGDPVYWDENSGAGCSSAGCPSSASGFDVGTIPSESFTIDGNSAGPTPEPATLTLLGSGVVGLVGLPANACARDSKSA